MPKVTVKFPADELPEEAIPSDVQRAILELAEEGVEVEGHRLKDILEEIDVRADRKFPDPEAIKYILVDCGVAATLGIELFKIGLQHLWPEIKKRVRKYSDASGSEGS